MAVWKVNERDQWILDALKKAYLRTPGAVSKRVVKILHMEELNDSQLDAARLEYHALGLDAFKGVR